MNAPTTPFSLTMLAAIAAGGATGTILRYLVGQWMLRPSSAFPLATLAINLVGSFLIAVFARVLSTPDSSPVWRAALTVGLCGGFTTFSTFSAELVTLTTDGRWMRAVAYAALSLLGGVTAVVAGLATGARLIGSTTPAGTLP